MEREGSLPRLQVPVICPYPEYIFLLNWDFVLQILQVISNHLCAVLHRLFLY